MHIYIYIHISTRKVCDSIWHFNSFEIECIEETKILIFDFAFDRKTLILMWSYDVMIPSRILQWYPLCLVYFNAGFWLSDDTTVSVQFEHSFYLGCSAGSIVSSIDSLRLLVHSVDMWDDRAVTKLLLDVFALLHFSKLSPMCSIHSRLLAMIL